MQFYSVRAGRGQRAVSEAHRRGAEDDEDDYDDEGNYQDDYEDDYR